MSFTVLTLCIVTGEPEQTLYTKIRSRKTRSLIRIYTSKSFFLFLGHLTTISRMDVLLIFFALVRSWNVPIFRQSMIIRVHHTFLRRIIFNPSLAKHDIPCLNKQCRSISIGFFRSQLIWICTVCHSVCEFILII